MAKVKLFEEFAERYELWFEKHYYTYLSELNAVRKAVPEGKGIEIGGIGRTELERSENVDLRKVVHQI